MTQDATEEVTLTDTTPGEQLRATRQSRGLSIADIAKATRQSQDTLVALEEMKTDGLPATILRMQARSYAAHLGLDSEAIAAAYAEQFGSMAASQLATSTPRSANMLLKMSPYIGLGVAVVAVLAVGSILVFGAEQDESYDPLSVSSRVQMAVDQTPLHINGLSAATGFELSFRANRRAWIEVRGSDGTIFRSRHMAAGETYYPRMQAGWSVTAPDAGAFDILLDDGFVAPLGDDAQAVYSRSIDEISETAEQTLQRALAEREGVRPQSR